MLAHRCQDLNQIKEATDLLISLTRTWKCKDIKTTVQEKRVDKARNTVEEFQKLHQMVIFSACSKNKVML